MPKFRKKPIVIEAVCFDGANARAITDEIDPAETIKYQTDSKGPYAMIPTLEGIMVAAMGDFIIKGVKGELYPCKPDIFAATYEPVAEPPLPQMIAQRSVQLENERIAAAGSVGDSDTP